MDSVIPICLIFKGFFHVFRWRDLTFSFLILSGFSLFSCFSMVHSDIFISIILYIFGFFRVFRWKGFDILISLFCLGFLCFRYFHWVHSDILIIIILQFFVFFVFSVGGIPTFSFA